MIIEKYPTVSALQQLCADLFCGQIEFNVDFFKQTDDNSEDDNEEDD